MDLNAAEVVAKQAVQSTLYFIQTQKREALVSATAAFFNPTL